MGSQFSAPVKIRSERSRRGLIALLLVLAVLAAITVTGSGIAGASPKDGLYSPYVGRGGIDLNFDGVVSALDNSMNFMGNTDLIGGYLDCDGWDSTNRINDFLDASPGDGVITTADDCILQGYLIDNTPTFIHVVDGAFIATSSTWNGVRTPIATGWKLPAVYDTTDLALTAFDSTTDWVWNLDAGLVDYTHNGTGDENDDATDFLPYGRDVKNGYVDVDLDGITDGDGGDDCTACFFGYDVTNGVVQISTVSSPYTTPIGATGPAGTNGVSGRVSISASTSTNSMNKSKSAMCSGTTKVMGGGYTITGAASTLAHLTVVANGQISGGWKVRVLEATPTAGTWAVTVNVICATA